MYRSVLLLNTSMYCRCEWLDVVQAPWIPSLHWRVQLNMLLWLLGQTSAWCCGSLLTPQSCIVALLDNLLLHCGDLSSVVKLAVGET